METTYQLDLFTDNFITIKKTRKSKPAGRVKDSFGRFVKEVELPSTEEFNETQNRRELSVSIIIRLQAEKILKLESELKQYRNG